MLAGALVQDALHLEHKGMAVAREELDGGLGGLVGAEQTVIGIKAAAVEGSLQNIV